MATEATGVRASRRSAATAARRNIAAQPAPTEPVVVTPSEIADDIDAQADEAFGPDELTPDEIQSQTQHVNGGPAAGLPNGQSKQRTAAAIALPMQQIALPMQQEDLTRQINAGDMILPKLRISQAMSKTNTLYQTSKGSAGVQQGNWYHSTTGENLGEACFFVPADMRKSRSMFVQGAGLMCRSFDMLNGEGDPGGPCEGSYEERLTTPAAHRGCPLRHWNENTPPKCGITYNFFGLVIRESEIEDPAKAKPLQAVLQLRSTASQAAKAIITMVMNEGEGTWHNVVVELGLDGKTNTKGYFYIPTAEFYDTTEDEKFGRLRRRAAAMARQMGSQTMRSSMEDDDA